MSSHLFLTDNNFDARHHLEIQFSDKEILYLTTNTTQTACYQMAVLLGAQVSDKRILNKRKFKNIFSLLVF